MALDRLTKVTGSGIKTDTNWVGNNANFTGITTTGSSFNVGVSTFHSTLAEVHNIKSTGIITATGGSFSGNVTAVDGTFTGNVSIAGTLTYEDVTNIDSVGIITALGFKTRGTSSDSGVTNAFTAGRINIYDNNSHNIFRIGTSPSFAPTVWQTSAITFTASSFSVTNTQSTREYININNSTGILKLGYGGVGSTHGFKFETSAKGIKVGTGVTVETNGQAEVAGITTFYKDVHIKSGTNRLYLGTTDRLSLIADPSHSYLRNSGSSSHFQIHSNNFSIRSYDGNGSVTLFYSPLHDGNEGGGPRLYHNHGAGIILERLRTTKSGVNIVGTTTSTQLAITGVSTFTGAIDANGDLDVDGHTNLDNVSIAGVVTATTYYGDGSNLSNITSTTINNNADNRVITGTGSANTLNAESNVHVDGSGRLLVGTSTNNAHANADNAVISGTGNIGLSIMSTDSGRSSIYFGDSSSSPGSYAGFIDFVHSSNSFNVGRGNDNSLTIDSSGRVIIGTTIQGTAGADELTLSTGGSTGITIRSGSSNDGNLFFAMGTTGNETYRGFIQYEHSNNAFRFGTNATERLRITSDGDVDVATGHLQAQDIKLGLLSDRFPIIQRAVQSAGSQSLTITGGSGYSEHTGTNHVVTDARQGAMIQLGGGNPTSDTYGGGIRYYAAGHTSPNNPGTGNQHTFYTRSGVDTNTERFRINHDGKIGASHNLAGTADYNRLMLHNPASGSCWMQLTSTATGSTPNTDGLSIGLNTSNIAHIWLRENADMYFGTNNSRRWTITSSGDVYPQGNYSIGLNSNTAFRMQEVNSVKFVHRYGNSGSATNNQQEAIWYGGGITVMHDNQTLQTTNYTWGLTGNRGYPLIRIRNANNAAIYAEAGGISSGSDYRMKENIEEITNGIETVKKLKPSIYNIRKSFNPEDDGTKHHGFIAHEVQEAIPHIGNIVTGTKDAMEEVFYHDDDENIPEGKKAGDSTGTFTDNPDMQGIDYGHMTPVLAAAIKELITKVETLEAKVTTLEGS